jgi:hypothetical protein
MANSETEPLADHHQRQRGGIDHVELQVPAVDRAEIVVEKRRPADGMGRHVVEAERQQVVQARDAGDILLPAHDDMGHAHQPGGMAHEMRLFAEADRQVRIRFALRALHQEVDADRRVRRLERRQHAR